MKSVTNILNRSITHLVSNIRHQHRCDRFTHITSQRRVAKAGIDSYFEKKIIIQEENDKILEKRPFLEVL